MQTHVSNGVSYEVSKSLPRVLRIVYQSLRQFLRRCRKYIASFYAGLTNSSLDTLAAPSGRARSLPGDTHPDDRGSQTHSNTTMSPETGPDYETSGHESTAFETDESEPQHVAEGHATDGGSIVEDELPDHLTTMQTLGGTPLLRCLRCGSEGATEEDLNHRAGCPAPTGGGE